MLKCGSWLNSGKVHPLALRFKGQQRQEQLWGNKTQGSMAMRQELSRGNKAQGSMAVRQELPRGNKTPISSSKARTAPRQQDTGINGNEARTAPRQQDTGTTGNEARTAPRQQDTGTTGNEARTAPRQQDTGTNGSEAESLFVGLDQRLGPNHCGEEEERVCNGKPLRPNQYFFLNNLWNGKLLRKSIFFLNNLIKMCPDPPLSWRHSELFLSNQKWYQKNRSTRNKCATDHLSHA